MSSFLSTQDQRVQHHFEVLEIDLPVQDSGYGTPLSAGSGAADWDESTDGYKTYYFTNSNAPILPSIGGEPVYRLITSISEVSAELKPGSGLAGRSSLTVNLLDITNKDPNKGAPLVDSVVTSQGTYLGKLAARQIFENKKARLKLYRVEDDGSIDLDNGAQTRHFLTDTLSLNTNDSATMRFKDVLATVNLGEKEWPINQGGVLRLPLSSGSTLLQVDDSTDYAAIFSSMTDPIVRIGDEFMEVDTSASGTDNGVSFNQTTSARIQVKSRGGLITSSSNQSLTYSEADDHNSGDEVFICYRADDQSIDQLLYDVLTSSGVDASYIPVSDWSSEAALWLQGLNVNTIYSESDDVNSVIKKILNAFLLDMWLDVVGDGGQPKIRLSAISVHRETQALLTEGKEINARTVRKIPKPALRATRALVKYNQRDLSKSDDFRSAARYSDDSIINNALYREHKDKRFKDNNLLNKDSADLLVRRHVERFRFMPYSRPFKADERFIKGFKIGDIVDMVTKSDQNFEGGDSTNIRGQVTKITPNYRAGRVYDVDVLTYDAPTNSKVITSPTSQLNIYNIFGRPAIADTWTIIFDGSYSFGVNAIVAGDFPANSNLIVVLANGFIGQARGGRGGNANGGNGGDGSIVFQGSDNAIDIDIHFAPTASNQTVAGYTPSGSILAPGGGGGAGDLNVIGPGIVAGGGGGGGGAGNEGGGGGSGGTGTETVLGSNGSSGNTSSGGAGGSAGGNSGNNGGSGGGLGMPGNAASVSGGVGGLAGSGIINNNSNITLHGAITTGGNINYINGNGDH